VCAITPKKQISNSAFGSSVGAEKDVDFVSFNEKIKIFDHSFSVGPLMRVFSSQEVTFLL
jgi:hypothetical protein